MLREDHMHNGAKSMVRALYGISKKRRETDLGNRKCVARVIVVHIGSPIGAGP